MFDLLLSGRAARAGLALASLLLITISAEAQDTTATQGQGGGRSGTITGTIVDSETGEPLIGANAVVQGTTQGTATNLQGRYRITGVSPGTYTLNYSYIGYNQKTVQNVEVQPGQPTTIDISLTSEAVGLEEVTVEARAVRDTEAALLRERQKSSSVSNAVSAETISRSGAGDAADALEKVTGASVVGGRYVNVRGLGGRYVSTQLNGAALPSADPDQNAVPLDIFPSGLLDNVSTQKTFVPDMPGDFSGGLVNINTASFPSQLNFSVSVSTGFNTNVAPGDDLLSFSGGGVDVLGNASGDLGMPSVIENAVENGGFPNPFAVGGDPEAAAALEQLSGAFGTTMAPTVDSAPIDQSFSVSIGNQIGLLGRPFGYVGGFNWSQSYSGYQSGAFRTFRAPPGGEDLRPTFEADADIPGPLTGGGTELGTEEVLYGGLLNLSYQITGLNEIGLNLLYNKNTTSDAFRREGRFFDGTLSPNTSILQSRSLLFVERELISGQLRGEHALSQGGVRVEWDGQYARMTQEEPDYRIFENQVSGENFDNFEISPSAYDLPTRFFRDLEEDSFAGNVDLHLPVGFLGQNGKFQVGGTAEVRERSFRQSRFQYGLDVDYEGNENTYFSEENVGIIDTVDGRFVRGNYITTAFEPIADYDGTKDVYAGYLMADFYPLPQLRVIGGVRVERSEIEVTPIEVPSQSALLDNTDYLPSLNLVYALTDEMNLRAAYGRTLARPNFRELAPYSNFELRNGRTFVGNPNLVQSKINNFDLRWEWFPRPGEILAASIFYKGFQDPIELTYIARAVNQTVEPANLNDATVFGAEFEASRGLDFLPGLLANLSLGGNLTLTHSEVSIPEDNQRLRLGDDDTRPLQGQSPYVVNLDLGYEDEGTSINLFYNVFGERLNFVALGRFPDVYEEPRHVLDLTASQEVAYNVTLKLSAKNLLGAEYQLSQESAGEEFISESYEEGRSFSLSVAYTLN